MACAYLPRCISSSVSAQGRCRVAGKHVIDPRQAEVGFRLIELALEDEQLCALSVRLGQASRLVLRRQQRDGSAQGRHAVGEPAFAKEYVPLLDEGACPEHRLLVGA